MHYYYKLDISKNITTMLNIMFFFNCLIIVMIILSKKINRLKQIIIINIINKLNNYYETNKLIFNHYCF